MQRRNSRIPRSQRLIESVARDSGYAFRVLRKSPGFTAAVVFSLALGIGANTAIFSLMDAVMWRMLPVKNPEGLLVAGRQQRNSVQTGFNYGQYRLIRDNNSSRTWRGTHRSPQCQRRRSSEPTSRVRSYPAVFLPPRREPVMAGQSVPMMIACRTGTRSRCSAMAIGTGDSHASTRPSAGRFVSRQCRSPSSASRRQSSSVWRSGRAGYLRAAHDAAHGHAFFRESARKPHRQQEWVQGSRARSGVAPSQAAAAMDEVFRARKPVKPGAMRPKRPAASRL